MVDPGWRWQAFAGAALAARRGVELDQEIGRHPALVTARVFDLEPDATICSWLLWPKQFDRCSLGNRGY